MSEKKRPDADAADAKPLPPRQPEAPDLDGTESGVFLTDEEHDGWAPIRRRPPQPEGS